VDIRHPQRPEAIVSRIDLRNGALSCSATRHPEQDCSDIINPLTGLSLQGDAACLVLADNATTAEIYSTALLAMGREQAIQYLTETPDVNARVGWIGVNSGPEWIASGKQ
jgi:thiamine biosynthesis lipoprotein ApbE